MSRKALGSVALVLAALGCSAAGGPPASDAREGGQPQAKGLPGNPRFFQLSPDDTYWVTHDTSHDRVLSSGARLELSSTGEVLASAWDTDKASAGDVLAGGLAVAPRLGGGYLFWTQSRVFRSTDFTGPLVPVSLGLPDPSDVNIRGLRNGLRSVLIATDAGPRELLPNAAAATANTSAGVTDLAAIDASRALRLDAFGRTAWTVDGGKTWNDALQIVGSGVRNLTVSTDEVWFETNNGRAVLGHEGTLAEPDGPSYRYVDYQRPFQVVFKGTRADRDDQYYGGYRENQPLQAAIASGVRLPDGTGFGVMRGAVVRVDLTTGKILSLATDWLPNGLECQPMQMGASILFACASEDYQSGTYVLRSDGTTPPKVERFFSDDGAFVTDDDGAFGFTGSCKAEDRYVDPDRYYGRYGGRYGYDGEEEQASTVQPVICVRRGADDWVERRLELDEDTQLVAWIPRSDGTAVALVRGTGRGEALPDLATDSQRETSQNGVRVVRLFREVEGWAWSAQQARTYYSRNQGQTIIDRRYRALDDGSIVGWLSTSEMEDRYTPVSKWTGAVLRPGGRTEVFELPATPAAMATGGPFGLLTTREGKLFETTDRGRTWRAAGRTALPPSTMQGSCTSEGCTVSTGARAGWGTAAITPHVNEEKREELPKPKSTTPLLVCEPQGMPKAEESTTSPAAATLGSQAKISIQTTFGATLEMIRETPDALSSASPYSKYGGYSPPPPVATAAPSASAAASSKAKAKAAPTRTHTLVLRPPLDPLAPIARLNATNATLGYRNRGVAIPLLGPGLDVSFLFYADQTEALADRNDIVTMPQFDTRRYYYYYGDNTGVAPGIRTASAKAMLLGDNRRRSALEEHGYSPQKPAFYFAFDREVNRRRGLTMGRRDDGGTGILVLDSSAPEVAGVAPFDRVATTLGDITKLAAWSTLLTADDPACRADKKGYRALIPIDPSLWFTLDTVKLPGVTLAKQGIALVRWSDERVCLEGIDVAVLDPRRRPDAPAGENLVIRWGPSPSGKAPSKDAPLAAGQTIGALRSLELMQPLTCSLERPTASAK